MIAKHSLNLQEQIEMGVSILKEGGVIAYPTDTVYGLGAGIGFPDAVNRIYSIKERPLSIPLPLLASDLAQIDNLRAFLQIRRFARIPCSNDRAWLAASPGSSVSVE